MKVWNWGRSNERGGTRRVGKAVIHFGCHLEFPEPVIAAFCLISPDPPAPPGHLP